MKNNILNQRQTLHSWAVRFTQEIYQFYIEHLPDWESGLKVFYNDVQHNPNLMIMGFQPGGGKEDYEREDKSNYETGMFAPPITCAYSESDWRFSVKLRALLDYNTRPHTLDNAVSLQLVCFRAASIACWNQRTNKRVNHFCYQKTKEAIHKINPKILLVIGFRTYDLLKSKVFQTIEHTNEIVTSTADGKRLHILAHSNGMKIIATPHISGAWLTKEKLEQIRKFADTHIRQCTTN